MINLRELELTNVVTYKNAAFKLNEAGVHVIRGDNRAGKSLIFSCLGNVLYFGHPLDPKKNAANKLVGSDSIIKLSLEDQHQHQYEIIQYGKRDKVKYSVLKNGADLHARTTGFSKEEIRSVFPLKEEHFYSLVYLNSFRPHVLLHGTSSSRYDFFERIFDLEIYDVIQKELSSRNSELRKSQLTVDHLNQQIEQVTTQVQDSTTLKQELEQLTALYASTQGRIAKLHKDHIEYNSYYTAIEQLQTTKSGSQLAILIKQLSQQQQQLSSGYDSAVQYEKRLYEYERIEKRLVVAKEKLQQFPTEIRKFNEQQAELEIETLKTELLEVERYIDRLSPLVAVYDRYLTSKEKLKELKLVKQTQQITLEECSDQLAILRSTVVADQKLLNNIKKLLEDRQLECYTCGSQLTESQLQQLIVKLEAGIKEATKKGLDYKEIQQFLDLKRQLTGFSKQKLADNKELIKPLTSKIAGIESNLSSYRKYKELKSVYQSIKLPDLPVKTEFSSKELQDQLTIVQSELQQYKSDLKIHEKIKDSSIYRIKKDRLIARKDKLRKELDELNEEQQQSNNKIQLLKSELAVNEDRLQTIAKHRDQIAKYSKELENKELYESLLEAYGAKGLRIQQIENLAILFEQNLNKYADLVFGEPFKFKVEVTRNNFQILAERSGKISEVTLLSGSESRCFQLCCLIALLAFIPEKHRTNFVVLDEIEAGMSSHTKQLFVNEFIPKLQTIIPNIIIVTPQTEKEFYVPHAKEYYVTKCKGESQINCLSS